MHRSLLFSVLSLGLAAPGGAFVLSAGAEAKAPPDHRRPDVAGPQNKSSTASPWPEGFVDVSAVAPSVVIDLKYATADNFVGARIDGYEANRAILTLPAALALGAAAAELANQGLGLKVFDAYRPQRAVQHFLRWAQSPAPAPRAATRHPGLSRRDLFRLGYLSLESAHVRGSAVDVTLLEPGPDGGWREMDLGTPYDYFSPASGDDARELTPPQRAARARLRAIMVKHGFVPSPREWWHFTLADEPYPDDYYDFPVR